MASTLESPKLASEKRKASLSTPVCRSTILPNQQPQRQEQQKLPFRTPSPTVYKGFFTPVSKAKQGNNDDNDADSVTWGFPSTPMPPPSNMTTPIMTPLSLPDGTSMDELDIILCHESFSKLLSVAAQIKAAHQQQSNNNNTNKNIQRKTRESGQGTPRASEVSEVVARVQKQLLSSSAQRDLAFKDIPKISQGTYPMTDSLIDDSLAILQKELDWCRTDSPSSRKSPKEITIAVKYSKWQTDILMQWMIDHRADPFPTSSDIEELTAKTKLSHSQIINWTTNVRKRNRKATCEDGKKPHHFIDFLFLAEKREQEAKQTSMSETPTSLGKRKAEANTTPGCARSPDFHPSPLGNSMDFPTSPAYHYYPSLPYPYPAHAHSPHHPGQRPYHYVHGTPPRHPGTPTSNRNTNSAPRFPSLARKKLDLPSLPEENADEIPKNDAAENTSEEEPKDVPEVKIKEEHVVEIKREEPQPDVHTSSPLIRIQREQPVHIRQEEQNMLIDLAIGTSLLEPIDVDVLPDNGILQDFVTYWGVLIKEEEEDNVVANEELQPDMTQSSSSRAQSWLVPSVSSDNHVDLHNSNANVEV